MTAPLASMTGFARQDGQTAGIAWTWEMRSVNGRGLDVRLRLPPGHDSLEPSLREIAGRALKRGNVTATLTIKRDEAPRASLDRAVLEQMLTLATELHRRIPGSAPPQAEALLALPGVLRSGAATDDPALNEVIAPAVQASFQAAIDALVLARRAEGGRLSALLTGLLGEIATLHEAATELAAVQPTVQRGRLLESINALLRDTPGLSEERIAQEVALLASRSDVREELDRLGSHIAAAHALLAEGANIGRRFDFLVQEFNREANTLCSKSAVAELTATGLRLKAAIEQMREQVQNIE
jgi:uncharacterized protein (TIGR00255 family)